MKQCQEEAMYPDFNFKFFKLNGALLHVSHFPDNSSGIS